MTLEYDAYLDMQPDDHFDPPYHEQLAVMQELEMTRETALKQEGASTLLKDITATLTLLSLRDDVQGDYFWGIHTALELIRSVAKGGVA
jgi:hypothetical protein